MMKCSLTGSESSVRRIIGVAVRSFLFFENGNGKKPATIKIAIDHFVPQLVEMIHDKTESSALTASCPQVAKPANTNSYQSNLLMYSTISIFNLDQPSFNRPSRLNGENESILTLPSTIVLVEEQTCRQHAQVA